MTNECSERTVQNNIPRPRSLNPKSSQLFPHLTKPPVLLWILFPSQCLWNGNDSLDGVIELVFLEGSRGDRPDFLCFYFPSRQIKFPQDENRANKHDDNNHESKTNIPRRRNNKPRQRRTNRTRSFIRDCIQLPKLATYKGPLDTEKKVLSLPGGMSSEKMARP
jgi:hypothetical protein